ncbi:ficolin-2-like [Physella acuta]|uniref:ficolin-2-like n=1 Tax=Physella acuta TaxID=109671 RepID=UPI0027DDA25B|nr:ficolin-2-like [Physella acuta]
MKYKGKDYYAVYRGFKVENEAAKYKMRYTSFSGGNVEDSFKYHNGMKFTTIDSDNDKVYDANCAVKPGGGWWYEKCHYVSANGKWASREFQAGIHWNKKGSLVLLSRNNELMLHLRLRQNKKGSLVLLSRKNEPPADHE